MKVFTVMLPVLVVSACGSDSLRIPTSPPTAPLIGSPSAPRVADRQITVGEVVKDTLIGHGSQIAFEFTAPSNGTVLVQVTWDQKQGRIELWSDGTPIPVKGVQEGIVGTLSVIAGQSYRIGVHDGAPWDYDDLYLPFVLTTWIH